MELILVIFVLLAISNYIKIGSLEKKIEQLKDELLYQSSKWDKEHTLQNDSAKFAESKTLEANQEEEQVQESSESYQEEHKVDIAEYKPIKIDVIDEYKSYNIDAQEVEPKASSSFLSSLFSMDNILVKLGAVVLFFGLAFLAKYAIEHSFISVKLRMLGLIAVGLALGFVGFKVRDKNRVYAMIMQGLGVAVIYLTIFSASKFYGLLSLQSAFGLMLLVVVTGSLLALKQNSLELALFSAVGGFLVPILTSDGSNRHILLFGYYALLNIGILFMAYRKSWRVLNLAGFVFTFGISAMWGVLRYKSELFSTTEPFLLLYFAIYLIISILFIKNATANPNRFIDTTLTFGLPIATFLLQLKLVEQFEYGNVISALLLGTLYLLLYALFRKENKILGNSYLAIGIIFYTVAIPFYFGKQTTGMMWALEGALVIWITAKQEQFFARLFGEFVLIVATAIYMLNASLRFISVIDFFGYLVVGASLIFSGYILSRVKRKDSMVQYPMLGVGLFVLLISILAYLEQKFNHSTNLSLLSLLIVGTFAFIFSKFREWKALNVALNIFAPLGVLNIAFLTAFYELDFNPMYGFNFLIWLVFFLLIYAILFNNREWKYATFSHMTNLVLVLIVTTLSLHYMLDNQGFSDAVVETSWILPTVATILLLGGEKLYGTRLAEFKSLYKDKIRGMLLVVALIWCFLANFVEVDSSWYIPLFNLLELIQLAVLVLAGLYIYRSNLSFKSVAFRVLAVLGLIFATAIYARAISHYMDLNYSFDTLASNLIFQTGLSILWASIGLGFMLLSKKYANREFWIVGFGLLAVTVAKLFLVELSNSGTVERIVSFIAVGALMLLIGYIVPIPPSREDVGADEE